MMLFCFTKQKETMRFLSDSLQLNKLGKAWCQPASGSAMPWADTPFEFELRTSSSVVRERGRGAQGSRTLAHATGARASARRGQARMKAGGPRGGGHWGAGGGRTLWGPQSHAERRRRSPAARAWCPRTAPPCACACAAATPLLSTRPRPRPGRLRTQVKPHRCQGGGSSTSHGPPMDWHNTLNGPPVKRDLGGPAKTHRRLTCGTNYVPGSKSATAHRKSE